MSRKRWSRYEPPSEPRGEDGAATGTTGTTTRSSGRGATKTKPQPTSGPRSAAKQPAKQPARKPARQPARQPAKQSHRVAWWSGGILLAAVVGLPVAVGVIAAATDDEAGSEPVDLTLLDEGLVADGLAGAAAEVGEQAVTVRLSEYALQVEFYDPNADQVRTYEVDKYTDGYRVQVEDNHYDDYRPRPFDLATVDAGVLVDVTEQAIARAEDPYAYSVDVRADRDTGEVEIAVWVSTEDGDDVELTADLDGEVIGD